MQLDPVDRALNDNQLLEYVDGQFIEKNVSVQSSFVGAEFVRLLGNASIRPDRTRIARVYGSDLTYRCWPEEPRRSRRPDASVVRVERLAGLPAQPGVMTIVPDLAVEVISPNDTAGELNQKLQHYRQAGFPLVWVVDPEARLCDVYDASGVRRLQESDVLALPELLPAFEHRLGDLLGPADDAT